MKRFSVFEKKARQNLFVPTQPQNTMAFWKMRLPKLSDFEKGKIVTLHDLGKTSNEIGKALKRPARTIRDFLARTRQRAGDVTRRFSSGRPRKTSTHMDRRIAREVTKNRKTSVKEIKHSLGLKGTISETTIRRRLRESGFRGTWTDKKPLISATNRARRLAWARKHRSWSVADWRGVVFSDESPYTVRGTIRQRVWKRPNDRYTPSVCTPTTKHLPKINVWGCFCFRAVGRLHKIDGIMNADMYKQILIHHLNPSIKTMFPAKNPKFVFQQDNDPKHRAKIVQNYLQNKGFDVLDWPAQSPDLNPIENLWSIIEFRLKDRMCSNEQQLFELLQREWNALEPSLLQSLVDSMPARCLAVIEAKGWPTKY